MSGTITLTLTNSGRHEIIHYDDSVKYAWIADINVTKLFSDCATNISYDIDGDGNMTTIISCFNTNKSLTRQMRLYSLYHNDSGIIYIPNDTAYIRIHTGFRNADSYYKCINAYYPEPGTKNTDIIWSKEMVENSLKEIAFLTDD